MPRKERQVDPVLAIEMLKTMRTCDVAKALGIKHPSTVTNAVRIYKRRLASGHPNGRTAIQPGEIEFVRANWEAMTDAEMAKKLGRTENSVFQIRTVMLKLYRDPNKARISLAKLGLAESGVPADLPPEVEIIIRNRLHLLDIKRAGYCYGFGELRMRSDV
jgi:hypothetical protein